jgi:hypothetical protein
MPLLFLEPTPSQTSKGEILKLLCDQGGIAREHIGAIEIQGRTASIDVPERWQLRLVSALQGVKLGDRRLRVWIEASQRVSSSGGEDHFQRLLRLMELEADAEEERAAEMRDKLSPAAAEEAGIALVDLKAIDVSPGLGGRYLITLVKRNRTLELPWTRIGVGAPTLLSRQARSAGERGLRGVVASLNKSRLVLAVADVPEDFDDDAIWRLDRAQDEIARLRARAALDRARAATSGRLVELRKTLLGERPPRFRPARAADQEIRWLDPSLDASQQDAVRLALEAEDIAIIHGPPGTGKTTSVVELIRQAVARGERVLAAAPSNVAVDNMLERLVAANVNAVRLGHPARVAEALREHSLDLMVEGHEDLRLARKLVKEAMTLRRQAGRYTRAKPAPGAKQAMRREARELMDDARRIEQQTVEQILDSAEVLSATLTGMDDELLGDRRFDLVVIDEAGQSTEPPMWIPLARAGRLVLAGDHCQLPPTVISPQAIAEGFAVSLLERLAIGPGRPITTSDAAPVFDPKTISRRLITQYRMHATIQDFSSQEFYEGSLTPHASVAGHVLADLPGVERSRLTESPAEWIDTAGAGYEEELEPDGESRLNPGEAQLVCRYVGKLVAAGVPADEIAVIAPYAAQVRLLRKLLRDLPVEIDSVDGFQGREKEAVLVSTVRSNTIGENGF